VTGNVGFEGAELAQGARAAKRGVARTVPAISEVSRKVLRE